MRKFLMSTAAIAVVAAFAMPAHAECDGFYGAIRAGVAQHDVSASSGIMSGTSLDDNKLMISGALGYRYEHWRAELEYVWRDKTEHKRAFGKTEFKSYSYMLNAYYDLMPYNWWTPYVGVGIGLTQLDFARIDTLSGGVDSIGNYDPLNFTWSVGGGLSLKVTNRFNVDVGYRYYDMGGIHGADITAQEIYGGLRYVF